MFPGILERVVYGSKNKGVRMLKKVHIVKKGPWHERKMVRSFFVNYVLRIIKKVHVFKENCLQFKKLFSSYLNHPHSKHKYLHTML
jgi:hypothetical protein